MIKIGITGTRDGMNEYQFEQLAEFLDVEDKFEFHHGDCVGVDAEAAVFAKMMGHYVVCHPPTKTNLRAFTEYDECKEAFDYLTRDRHIVDAVDLLIVVPLSKERPKKRSGTWYTHDYAVKKGVQLVILYPNK